MSRGVGDEFWKKVALSADANSCWEWQGARKPTGYGNVRIGGKYLLAHRVAYRLAHGEIPDGMQVCHICDNPPCCNPRHLMLGNPASNYCDSLIKGRSKLHKIKAVGEKNAKAKLTADQVRTIRKLYQEKSANQYELAEQFGVSQPAIGAIVRNETWRHV